MFKPKVILLSDALAMKVAQEIYATDCRGDIDPMKLAALKTEVFIYRLVGGFLAPHQITTYERFARSIKAATETAKNDSKVLKLDAVGSLDESVRLQAARRKCSDTLHALYEIIGDEDTSEKDRNFYVKPVIESESKLDRVFSIAYQSRLDPNDKVADRIRAGLLNSRPDFLPPSILTAKRLAA